VLIVVAIVAGSLTDCRGRGGLTFRSDVLQHATSMRDKTVRDNNNEATMVGGQAVNLGSCKGTKGRKRRSWGETRDVHFCNAQYHPVLLAFPPLSSPTVGPDIQPTHPKVDHFYNATYKFTR